MGLVGGEDDAVRCVATVFGWGPGLIEILFTIAEGNSPRKGGRGLGDGERPGAGGGGW